MNQALQNIQYVSDAQGKAISVIVPIELWQTMQQQIDESASKQKQRKKVYAHRVTIDNIDLPTRESLYER